MKDATRSCVDELKRRHVTVPDQFPFELESALVGARRKAILLLVRHQADSLIQHVSSGEACHVWAEAEAAHVMST